MSFTESKIIKQITVLPASGGVQVQWANQVLKEGVVLSETFERKAYDATLAGFDTEVGSLDVNAFLAAFDAATLDAKVEALAAKATAEAALATANATIAQLQAQIDAFTPTAPTVTGTVTARQIRMALTQVGLREAVEAAVAQGDQATKDWYEYANEFERTNPLVVAMGVALGVSDDDLDALFALAATL